MFFLKCGRIAYVGDDLDFRSEFICHSDEIIINKCYRKQTDSLENLYKWAENFTQIVLIWKAV